MFPFSKMNGIRLFPTSSKRLPLIVIETINIRQKQSRCFLYVPFSSVAEPSCVCTEMFPPKLATHNGPAPSRNSSRHARFIVRSAVAIAHKIGGARGRRRVVPHPRSVIVRPSKQSIYRSGPVCSRASWYMCPGVAA
jgi:hypothetical protein